MLHPTATPKYRMLGFPRQQIIVGSDFDGSNFGIFTIITAVFTSQIYNTLTRDLTSGITSLLTVLDLFCPASSSLSLMSLSDPSLSVSSVSHLLKRILCRPEREHLQWLSFSVHENTSVDSQRLTIGCLYMRCRVNVFVPPDNDTGNLVTEPESSNGRPLRFRYSGFQRHATLL
jgi:hypothetical protein